MNIEWLQKEVQKGQDVDWQQYGNVKTVYQGDLVLGESMNWLHKDTQLSLF